LPNGACIKKSKGEKAMKDFELKIEYIELDQLTPYEKNAR
jgi:hypothetical protein